MKDLAAIIARHVDACVTELRAAVSEQFAAALGSAVPVVPAPERSRPRRIAPERAAPAAVAPRAPKPQKRSGAKREAAGVKPVAKPVVKSGRTCGCGPVGRHRRECKLATGTGPRAKATRAAADPEDSSAAPPQAAARPPRTPGDAPVIPHLALVAMLAADRMAASGGDAGGYVSRPDASAPIVAHPAQLTTAREHCPDHGWVGRLAFARDGHEHCAPAPSDAATCEQCNGSGWATARACRRCDGLGYMSPEHVEDDSEPLRHGRTSPTGASSVDEIQDMVFGERRGRDLRRRPEADRAKSINVRHLLAVVRAEPAIEHDDSDRPRTRADCVNGPRPCPWVSCRHHLALDVDPQNGSLKLNWPTTEVEDMPHTCALDEADKGPHVLEAVGDKLNLTRERVRQVMDEFALPAMQQALKRQGVRSA